MDVDRLLREGRFLVSQSFLYSYGGSEVITLELVEQLAAGGATVAVVTHGYDEALADELRAAGGLLFRLDDPELDEFITQGVDVAWIHQQLVPEQLVRAPGTTSFVFNHMSSFHPLEFPWSPRVERGLASVVTFPSEESREAQLASGLLEGFGAEQLVVLGNPAPDAFLDVASVPSEVLSRVLVVSNHVPEELDGAIELLREQGVVVDLVGLQREKGGKPQRIRPESFDGVDAVITIGKTVQFALAAGVPVFCYDHFGGPGWLSEDNLDRAAWHNFSGRGFDHRAAEQIVAELNSGYFTARSSTAQLRDRLGDRLRWSTALRDVLHRAFDRSSGAPDLPRQDIEAHLRVQQSLATYMVMAFELDAARRWLSGQVDGLTAAVSSLRGQMEHLSSRNDEMRGEIDRLAPVEGELARALAREAEVSRAFRDARQWVVKAEADVAELRSALAHVELREQAADDAARRASTAADRQRERAEAASTELAEVRAERDALAASRVVRGARSLGLLRTGR